MDKKYKFLLFDADNTLFDFDASEAISFRLALEENGIAYKEEMLKTYSAINVDCWQMLERGEKSKEEIVVLRFARFLDCYGLKLDAAALNEDYEALLSRSAIVLEGARALLAFLKGKVRLYIVTNGLARVQKGRFARTDLGAYIDEVFISEEMGSKKPDALFFEKVALRIPGFSKEEALVIGDSLTSDIRGAYNFGVDCMWFNPKKAENTSGLPITKTVENFTEMKEFLEDHI